MAGEGVAANNETALMYFRQAIDLDSPSGYDGMGLAYLHGIGAFCVCACACEAREAGRQGRHGNNAMKCARVVSVPVFSHQISHHREPPP